jgi:predicted HD superfamily hydrolase involved in NAD metabolism
MRESSKRLDSKELSDAGHPQAVCEPQLHEPESHFSVFAESPGTDSLKPFRRKKVLRWLSENLPEKRLKHVLRVEDMAISLAQHHQLDVERAAQAGLMHDLAKYFKPKRLLEMAIAEGLPLDPVYESNPHLLHADVGAIVARDEFGVQDEEVLNAIRNHTLGSAGMSPLSCVVYLADSLEPGRGSTSELEGLRKACRDDLHRAVWLTSDSTMRSLLSSQHLIHPRALQTRNWAMQMTHQKHPARQRDHLANP